MIMDPLNRKEGWYAKMAGEDVDLTPLTREEAWFKEIADNSGGGGGLADDVAQLKVAVAQGAQAMTELGDTLSAARQGTNLFYDVIIPTDGSNVSADGCQALRRALEYGANGLVLLRCDDGVPASVQSVTTNAQGHLLVNAVAMRWNEVSNVLYLTQYTINANSGAVTDPGEHSIQFDS